MKHYASKMALTILYYAILAPILGYIFFLIYAQGTPKIELHGAQEMAEVFIIFYKETAPFAICSGAIIYTLLHYITKKRNNVPTRKFIITLSSIVTSSFLAMQVLLSLTAGVAFIGVKLTVILFALFTGGILGLFLPKKILPFSI